MRTFKLMLLSAVIAAVCSAASWDGIHGDLTVTTIQFSPRMLSIMGLGMVPGFTATATQIWVKSADPSVTGFRVTATFADDSGSHTVSILADAQSNGAMTMAPLWNLRIDQITSLTVTRLRDGETSPLK